jgi:hypothetical protein
MTSKMVIFPASMTDVPEVQLRTLEWNNGAILGVNNQESA